MLTYDLKKAPGVPLYESLYRCIRADILSGALRPGEKLPSKRALADHLEISKITVETAYAQLLSEGYLRSREKSGYYVEQVVSRPAEVPELSPAPKEPEKHWAVDLTSTGSGGLFPFSVWMRLQREVMLDCGGALLSSQPSTGHAGLRQAIADYLAAFRGMRVNPDLILIGAGTDFLCNLIPQLLGRDKTYAVEEPGYNKIRRIYAAAGVSCVGVPMDARGVLPQSLQDAGVLHISPSHHFPTGVVTPASRRQELLDWVSAGSDRWIVEDDYDSEFRFDCHPVPTLWSMDPGGKVIYMNTFSRSLAPSIRISYMVLPRILMTRFRERLGFYSCTVPSFEQYTLERFLHRGYFEKHINRMRKFYKNRRNRVISLLEQCDFASRLTILEQDAGLHFLLRIQTGLPDETLLSMLEARGIRARSLASYYHGSAPPDAAHTLVVSYSDLREDALETALESLGKLP